MINLKELILSFCAASTVSGTETLVDSSIFPNEYFDHTETDDMGNRYFYKNSIDESAPLVMIDSHFDEVGFLISARSLNWIKFPSMYSNGRISL